MLFFSIFTKGIKAKLNESESESDIFPQNEGKVGKTELTPVVKALTNCALAPAGALHVLWYTVIQCATNKCNKQTGEVYKCCYAQWYTQ